MKEYISREDALLHSEIIRVYSKDYGNVDVVPVEYLADIPAADVQPKKHGRWERLVSRQSGAHYEVAARCSCCNEYTVTICACEVMPFGFCPHCTADMRGDTNV